MRASSSLLRRRLVPPRHALHMCSRVQAAGLSGPEPHSWAAALRKEFPSQEPAVLDAFFRTFYRRQSRFSRPDTSGPCSSATAAPAPHAPAQVRFYTRGRWQPVSMLVHDSLTVLFSFLMLRRKKQRETKRKKDGLGLVSIQESITCSARHHSISQSTCFAAFPLLFLFF